MRVAEKADAQYDEDTAERELAAWRMEIRLHALAELARAPAKPPRWVRVSVLVLLVLLLTATLVGLRHAMRPKISPNEVAIRIVLVDESSVEPVLPVPPNIPRAVRSQTPLRVVAAKRLEPPPTVAVDTTSTPSEPEAPAYRVFNPDGSVILPAANANQGMQASFAPQSTAASPIMQHQRPLKVRPNHFAGNWQAPDGETILGSFVREHLTADTQFMTPWGTLVKCRVVAVMGGCTWGPPPARESRPTWRPATALDEE